MKYSGFHDTALHSAGMALVILFGCDAMKLKDASDSMRSAAKLPFDGIASLLKEKADAIVLSGDGNSRILVSPRLQGRIFTMRVGAVESTGLVNAAAIAQGETDPHFNNFGGLDRFWIGPEGGQFGIYFPPGAELNRGTWKVPPGFDTGAFNVVSKDANKVVMSRAMEITNYIGTKFEVQVEREEEKKWEA